MDGRVKELAEQAGFECWKDEPYRPKGQTIDWASNYDEELEKFAELVRADEREACARVCDRFIGTTMVCQAERIQSAIRARGVSTTHCQMSAREWVGLTDDDYNIKQFGEFDVVKFAKYIEAKLKEKNDG